MLRQLLFLLFFPTLVWAQTVVNVYMDGQGAGTGTVGDPWNDCAEAIAEAANQDLVTANNIWRLHVVDGNYDDTSTCLFDSTWTTSSTQYIEIVADFYHGGSWDDTKPIFKSGNKGGMEFVEGIDARIRGVQIEIADTASNCRGINIFNDGVVVGDSTYEIDGVLLKGSTTRSNPRGIRVTHSIGDTQTVTITNSVIFNGFLYGIEATPATGSTLSIYHTVSHGCDDNNCRNFQYDGSESSTTLNLKNSFFSSPSGTGSVDINASGNFATENIAAVFCSDADADGKCTSDNQTMSWTNTANGDFHLESGSPGENAGTDLTGTVDGDFDESSDWVSPTSVRVAASDVGPDERAAAASSSMATLRRRR